MEREREHEAKQNSAAEAGGENSPAVVWQWSEPQRDREAERGRRQVTHLDDYRQAGNDRSEATVTRWTLSSRTGEPGAEEVLIMVSSGFTARSQRGLSRGGTNIQALAA
ncbi:hypothetical protein [Paenibacillus tyrfis]|uniref:hypothetical protein n=1 Tax=Paenibacillus tyrfis TaxID=1501230 RepID=UPI00209CB24A|nr:hypothetical protein [Paenibacillus tyrfis]MCP1312175.1 hypothetical protein [Paenibacillus tyrfis]